LNKAYGLVIDLLMRGDVDFKTIGVELAKNQPETFLAMYQESKTAPMSAAKQHSDMQEQLKTQMDKELTSTWASDNRVAAIKRCREITGWGLREAKDYCEALAGGHDPKLYGPIPTKLEIGLVPASLDPLDDAIKHLMGEVAIQAKTAGNPAYSDQGAFS
jgi:hypothetical protein